MLMNHPFWPVDEQIRLAGRFGDEAGLRRLLDVGGSEEYVIWCGLHPYARSSPYSPYSPYSLPPRRAACATCDLPIVKRLVAAK